LNLIALDDQLAATRGVDVEAAQRQVMLGASLTTAALIAQTGPIGFVGLIIPHVLRPLTGDDQRLLLPASGLAGAVFLTLCDALARWVIAPQELPVGVITALLGGPFLIYVIARRQPPGPPPRARGAGQAEARRSRWLIPALQAKPVDASLRLQSEVVDLLNSLSNRPSSC
jgi:hypothetical protein